MPGPVPAPPDGHQHELGDRPYHQDVDRAVAVHGGHQVLVGTDPPHRLGAAGVAGEHSGGHEFLERSAHGGAVSEAGRAGHWPATALQVVSQRRDGGQHLGHGQRPVGGEQRHAHGRGRCHGRRPVDPVRHLQRDALDGMRLRRVVDAQLGEPLP